MIAETEFWPNIFAECGRRGIPLLLVNGRVSQASLRGYLRVPRIARAMLENADLLCAQTRTDAQRLRNLGAPEALVKVTGNLKFDVELPRDLLESGRALREQWGRERPVWIAASTHAGEERRVLDAFERLRSSIPDLLLVLVPRHPERFKSVARLCQRRGLQRRAAEPGAGRAAGGLQRAARRHDGGAAAALRGRGRRVHRRQPRAAWRAEPPRGVRGQRAAGLRAAHVPLRGDRRDGARARRRSPGARQRRTRRRGRALLRAARAAARGGPGRAHARNGQPRRARTHSRAHQRLGRSRAGARSVRREPASGISSAT